MHTLIKPAFGSCYGLIKHRWFSKLQFRSLRIKPELFESYFRDTCGITRQNMIDFLRANSRYSIKNSLVNCLSEVHIFVGQKENRTMHISAQKLHEMLKRSSLQILPEMYHGEFSINHPDDYVQKVMAIIKDTDLKNHNIRNL